MLAVEWKRGAPKALWRKKVGEKSKRGAGANTTVEKEGQIT
jgi:hypothetical protein